MRFDNDFLSRPPGNICPFCEERVAAVPGGKWQYCTVWYRDVFGEVPRVRTICHVVCPPPKSSIGTRKR